jgi:UDP-glucose 4-epimerase
MKKVLVTGAGGFLGRYIVGEFNKENAAVLGVDVVAPDIAPQGSGITYKQLLLPSAEFDRVLEDFKPDVFVHCAGRASVALSMEDPRADFTDSVVLTFHMLEALHRKTPDCRFIFLSSAAVYGNPPSLPVRESHPIAPLSPYGYHKRQCELLVEEFARVFRMPALALRIFSAYGRGLRRQVIWDICERALKTSGLRLRGNGKESRDFVHARDVARAVVLLADRAPANGEVYNVATGVESAIEDVAESLLHCLGLPIRAEFDGVRPPGDPANWRADITRISELGFAPTISLQEGLKEVALWSRSFVTDNAELPAAS